MKYEWEKKADNNPQIETLGRAVFHGEHIEGAFQKSRAFDRLSPMERADIIKDVIGDLNRLYGSALNDLHKGNP